MGTGNKMLGGNLRWTSIPPGGSSNTPNWLHFMETGISSGSVGQLCPECGLTMLLSLCRKCEPGFIQLFRERLS